MTDQTKARSGQISGVLLLVVGLLAGFVGGYAIGQRGAPAGPLVLDSPTATSDCPHELDPGDQDILAGFICPAPQCADPLLTCHCDIAHQIKDEVKQMLADGQSPDEVREEIRAKHKL